ncbi:MAG: hypothetical protein Tsb0017_05810 [Geothermobacteraceae bacterium]
MVKGFKAADVQVAQLHQAQPEAWRQAVGFHGQGFDDDRTGFEHKGVGEHKPADAGKAAFE